MPPRGATARPSGQGRCRRAQSHARGRLARRGAHAGGAPCRGSLGHPRPGPRRGRQGGDGAHRGGQGTGGPHSHGH
eukprot:94030-Alexandrium_andersonii.AAC.1